MTWANLAHLLLGAVLASVSQAIKTHVDQFLARRLAAMGLSANTKHALKIALGHQAANETIPLLDMLSDELTAEKAHNESKAKRVEGVLTIAPPAGDPPAPVDPPPAPPVEPPAPPAPVDPPAPAPAPAAPQS